MTGPDPRIEAAAEWLADAYGRGWKGLAGWKREAWLEEAWALLRIIDDMDPARDAFRGLGPLALELQRAEARRDS